MNDKYLFIIWSSALFCREKILSDLQNYFVIDKDFYIAWDKVKFIDNIKCFYGTKAPDYKEKIKYIGKGKFECIIVSDSSPVMENRITYNGEELVNAKVYDRKKLYRKWTAGNFRIHASITSQETIHDLTVLLGPNFQKRLDNIENGETVDDNTKGIEGFKSLKEFEDSLSNFNINILQRIRTENYIFTECKKDIVLFSQARKLDRCLYSVLINNREIEYKIFGERENDIPKKFLETYKKDIVFENSFNIVIHDYIKQLNKEKFDQEIIELFNKSNMPLETGEIESYRPLRRKSLIEKIKDPIKYLVCRIKA